MPGGSGHAEVGGRGGAGPAVDLGEFVFSAGEADFQADAPPPAARPAAARQPASPAYTQKG
jgi:hypothetical protein